MDNDNITEVVTRYGKGQNTSLTLRNGRIESVTTWVTRVPKSTRRTKSVPKRLAQKP